jgi:putative transposase
MVTQASGRGTCLLREGFSALRSRLPRLWTSSYFVAAVGGATWEVVKRYAENQKNV